MKRFIILSAIVSLFTTCYIFEPYDKIYYHDVGAEGYVCYQDKPVPNARICVWNEFKSNGYATKGSIQEHFTVDENSYFHVKFIRRTGLEDVIKYSISIYNDTLISKESIFIYPKELLGTKENVQLGKTNLITYEEYLYGRNNE